MDSQANAAAYHGEAGMGSVHLPQQCCYPNKLGVAFRSALEPPWLFSFSQDVYQKSHHPRLWVMSQEQPNLCRLLAALAVLNGGLPFHLSALSPRLDWCLFGVHPELSAEQPDNQRFTGPKDAVRKTHLTFESRGQ